MVACCHGIGHRILSRRQLCQKITYTIYIKTTKVHLNIIVIITHLITNESSVIQLKDIRFPIVQPNTSFLKSREEDL